MRASLPMIGIGGFGTGHFAGLERLRVLLAACLLFLAQPAVAEELKGRVVGITDGDTLTLLTERREQVRARLLVGHLPWSVP